MLQNGAEVNLPDARGCTPLTTIVGKDYIFDIIDMRLITTLAVLIQYGVDVRLPALPDYDRRMERDKSKSPEMPMCIAAKIGCLDFVQMLWLAGSGHGEVNELLRTGVRLYKATRRAFRKKKAEKIERKITSFLHSVAEQPRTLKDLARIQVSSPYYLFCSYISHVYLTGAAESRRQPARQGPSMSTSGHRGGVHLCAGSGNVHRGNVSIYREAKQGEAPFKVEKLYKIQLLNFTESI